MGRKVYDIPLFSLIQANGVLKIFTWGVNHQWVKKGESGDLNFNFTRVINTPYNPFPHGLAFYPNPQVHNFYTIYKNFLCRKIFEMINVFAAFVFKSCGMLIFISSHRLTPNIYQLSIYPSIYLSVHPFYIQSISVSDQSIKQRGTQDKTSTFTTETDEAYL